MTAVPAIFLALGVNPIIRWTSFYLSQTTVTFTEWISNRKEALELLKSLSHSNKIKIVGPLLQHFFENDRVDAFISLWDSLSITQ